MSTQTWRRLLVPAAAALLLAGCGSTGDSSAPPQPVAISTPAASIWPCLNGIKARVASPSPTLRMALLGVSPRVVVFSNESDEDLCSWVRFASSLVNQGYTAVLYDYGGDPVSDLGTVVRYLRSQGTAWIAMVGASEGAKASIIAATEVHPGPTVLVSLSAESALQGTAVAPYAARLQTPTLFVTSAEDLYGSTAATQGYYRSAPARTKHLLVQPGDQHGTALLADVPVQQAVLLTLRAAT